MAGYGILRVAITRRLNLLSCRIRTRVHIRECNESAFANRTDDREGRLSGNLQYGCGHGRQESPSWDEALALMHVKVMAAFERLIKNRLFAACFSRHWGGALGKQMFAARPKER
jgi:hypothetical protein